ncbi:MAG: hypothetical protein GY827_03625, partial [Cytophagales bacterium]|nr:hypothetical protein [Cytophagales bacterium]
LNLKKCKVLQGRKVCLFPDLSKNGHAFEKWNDEAKKLNTQLPNTKFKVSNLLELNGDKNERLKGNDLADYLIQLDWKLFQNQDTYKTPKTYTKVNVTTSNSTQQQKATKGNISATNLQQDSNNIATEEEKWNTDDLEDFFKATKLPQSMCFKGMNISNVTLFVNTHLTMVKKNNGNRTFLPYFQRLEQVKITLDI